jgi:DNA-binding CsgD family transcriptional regulator
VLNVAEVNRETLRTATRLGEEIMRAHDSIGSTQSAASVRDRFLGDSRGPRDEALIFAASSIIREITAPRYDGSLVEREVRTEQGSYTLQGSRAFGSDSGQPVVLIYAAPQSATAAAPVAPDSEELRTRFRLTRKEARVAELLVARYSNDAIAAELCISPHTARHHTQNVLSKLGVRSRREVVDVLSRSHS